MIILSHLGKESALSLLKETPYPRTPAMSSGISDHIWIIEEIVKLIR